MVTPCFTVKSYPSWSLPASISIVKLNVMTLWPIESMESVWCMVTPCFTVKPYSDWSLVIDPSVNTMRSCGLLLSWVRSLIFDSALPTGRSWWCLSKCSDRKVSQRCQNWFWYFSRCLVCLRSINCHSTCMTESSSGPISGFLFPVCYILSFMASWSESYGLFIPLHWSMIWPFPFFT